MLGKNNALLNDFSEYEGITIDLINSTENFNSMLIEYHELDTKIHNIEDQDLPISDYEFTKGSVMHDHCKEVVISNSSSIELTPAK